MWGVRSSKWVKHSQVCLHLIITRELFSREFVMPKIVWHLRSCALVGDTLIFPKVLSLLYTSRTTSEPFVFSNLLKKYSNLTLLTNLTMMTSAEYLKILSRSNTTKKAVRVVQIYPLSRKIKFRKSRMSSDSRKVSRNQRMWPWIVIQLSAHSKLSSMISSRMMMPPKKF